jgi:hypothetical protein
MWWVHSVGGTDVTVSFILEASFTAVVTRDDLN